MGIKNKILILSVFIATLTGLNCKKQPAACEKMGYEYSYTLPGITLIPSSDSLPLGSSVLMEVAVPKAFADQATGSIVMSEQPDIFGTVSIKKLTGDPASPVDGALDVVDFHAITGKFSTDTTNLSAAQLKIARTVYFANVSDSFRLKIACTPKEKGVFILSLGQVGNRNSDCALFKYFPRVRNPEQHLYFLIPLYGYVPHDDRVYCFKIY